MRFLADENIDRQSVAALRQAGHEVVYIAELDPGITDDQVLDLANREELLLLTADKDFGELVYRLHRQAHGIVLVRLAGAAAEEKAEIVGAVVRKHGQELVNAFSVITLDGIRIRRQSLE
jgi:predicted nuclease of predicted toxin-antitoxin system